MQSKIGCRACGKKLGRVDARHLAICSSLTLADYHQRYPGVATTSPADKDAKRRWMNAWYRTLTPEAKQRRRNTTRYKLSTTEWKQLYRKQCGRCAICGLKRKLSVDHSHETGRVRGLLCHHCNVGIGFFRDSPKRLESAAAYLERGLAYPA